MSSAVAVAYMAHFKTTTHKNKFKLKCDSLQTSNVKGKRKQKHDYNGKER